MPQGRTLLYLIWRSCERWSILPPDVNKNFGNNSNWIVAKLLAYEQIRNIEESPETPRVNKNESVRKR